MDSVEQVELHSYELDVNKIRTINDVRVIIQSLGIKYSDQALKNNPQLKKYIK